jgi:glycine/D-amino acid oxidase-like deaminating enzyme
MASFQLPLLVVGQGVAGSLVSWQLIKLGVPFKLIDKGLAHSASSASAGIVNPVTGRRVVKSWMIDKLLPYAKNCYTEIEEFLSIKLLHEQEIMRSLFSIKEENLWLSKGQQEEYEDYIDDKIQQEDLAGFLREPISIVKIHKSFRVDLSLFLHTLRIKLAQQDLLIEDTFNHESLEVEDDKIRYQREDYKAVIFCEGWNVKTNPWFKDLPLALNKGEALSVEIKECELNTMLKHRLFFVPQGKDKYWVGSNYQWDFEDDQPSEIMQSQLQNKLESVISKKFKVLKNLAGIRPSTDQRRPILGTHPKYSNLYIFNGMGTKGTSLAPYWSNQLVQHIISGKSLPKEVDVRTFYT